jgi:hypothetical protein
LDLDLVVMAEAIDGLLREAEKIFRIEKFPHSINLSSTQSDLRIQLQTDPRYQPFIRRTSMKDVIGYEMKVVAIGDVLQGELWAYLDDWKWKSKRQKDLADIYRLIEEYPSLKVFLPESMKKEL